ncbi:Fe-S cluster assembly transcriptional regulator IscR [Pseudomethylobacillus aquaticus]|uniref:Fe-S cluster assembly transcriptional regulator IscR n=1 Tax=Pseudomethylobacillus aquaticus TaxID=2676064 RepID=A0A3N0V614_9PROT|nr:Fe-S cluster assembly transcriptional regulator IscR [Pseudomethylobacillus aquaticus]ROH88143.1 Fe-S cluster assembly transcriptional regulator IscR [Pseudomethylobacillus aquaticus]
MRLTTKGRFAVTAMLDLALHDADKPVTLAGVSERQSISLSYLEQLFSRLRRGGLVKSVRGPGGGYRLAKLPHEITVSQIIAAVDELIDATQCGGEQNCHDHKRCMTHELWASLNHKILEYLSGVSLADLVATQREGRKITMTARACAPGSKAAAQAHDATSNVAATIDAHIAAA